MTDADEIAERLRAGLEGVTPGPWKARAHSESQYEDAVTTETEFVARCQPLFGRRHANAPAVNARHIANCSPENIRAILDDRERALKVAAFNVRLLDQERTERMMDQSRISQLEKDLADAQSIFAAILKNDGGSGSEGFDSRALMTARDAARAFINRKDTSNEQ